MGDLHSGVFLLVSLASVVSVKATVICPFDGDWKYHAHTGTCMSLQKRQRTFFYAKGECAQFKGGSNQKIPGRLVYIFDNETNEFVKGLLASSNEKALIGLNDRMQIGQHRWGDARNAQHLGGYTGWANGQPTRDAHYNCVAITAHGWEKFHRKLTAEFVCQVDPALALPTISCPPAEVEQRSSKIICKMNVSTEMNIISALSFKGAGQDVVNCSQAGCSFYNGFEGSMTFGAKTWTAVLHINTAQRHHEGEWSCSVTLTDGQKMTSKPCELKVYTVPLSVACKVSYFQMVMTVSCTTEPMYPEAECKWYITKSHQLEIQSPESIKLYHGQTIYYRTVCNASITWPKAGEYLFNVSVYPSVPGLDRTLPYTGTIGSLVVRVEPPKDPPVLYYDEHNPVKSNSLLIHENQSLTIACNIIGGTPEVYTATITCYSKPPNAWLGNSASTTITTTQDFHGRNCSCEGTHVTGWKQKTSVTFLVLSPPRITSFAINKEPVWKTENVSLTCVATGFPQFQLSLLHNQDLITTVNNSTMTHSFKATCSSTGAYTCLAEKNARKQEDKHIQLKVICAPEHCPGSEQRPTFGAAVGLDKTITMCVLVFPSPTSHELYKGETNLKVDQSRYRVNFTYTDEANGRGEITLTLLSVSQHDFGVYNMTSKYLFDYDNVMLGLKFELSAKGPPSCPENLNVSRTFSDAITLSWKPRFDGDLQQSFTIILYDDSGSTTQPQTFSVIPQPAGNLEDEMSYNVTGLSGSTTYTFGLRVENEGGVTNCTLQVQVLTIASSSSSSDQNLTIVVVIAVLVLVLLVITVVVFVFVHVGRRRARGVVLDMDTVLTPTRLVRSSSRDDERVAYETIDDVALHKVALNKDTVQTATCNGKPSSRIDEQNAYENANDVPNTNTAQTTTSSGRPSDRRDEQNAYETPKGGWLSEEVHEKNNEEAVYLNTQNPEGSNAVEGAD